jgi:hypothetical protein
MDENLVSLWAECDKKISAIGSATHAKKCRHKYMASDITDERYLLIFAIVAAEIRQSLESTFEKWGISKEEMQAASRVKKSRTPRAPKATEWAKQGKKDASLTIRDAVMPDEFDD